MKDKGDSGGWIGTLVVFVLIYGIFYVPDTKLRYAF